jgi:hypothetical protein
MTNKELINEVRVRISEGSYPPSFIKKVEGLSEFNSVSDAHTKAVQDMLILLNIIPKLAMKASKMNNVSIEEFYNTNRRRDKVVSQMIVVFLLIENGFYSKQILAEALGRKKHSTCIYMYKKCCFEMQIYTEIHTMTRELYEYAIQEFSNELSGLNFKSNSKWCFTQTDR